MKKPLFLIIQSFAIFLCQSSTAQEMLSDSLVHNQAMAGIRLQYTKTTGINSYLYTGTRYDRYWNGVRGIPFFITEDFPKGDLVYDRILYKEVPLVYDITREAIVTKTFSKENDLKLLPEKITRFTIDTHVFVRILADSLHETEIKTGFYEQLYQGTIAVFARYEKKIEQSLRAEDNFLKFTQYDRYYIEKDGVYHSVEGEDDIAAVLKDQKAELRKFLNRRDIRYKKDPSGTLVKVAAFYDRLKK